MFRSCLNTTAVAASLLTLITGRPAHAQDDLTEHVPTGEFAANDSNRNRGWNVKLSLNGSSNLTSNDQVIGQDNGTSVLLGTGIEGKLQYDAYPHRWVNELNISEMWVRTPSIDEFVKSNDAAAFQSMYNYFFWKWGGVFARVSAETALFKGERVTSAPQLYVLSGGDPTMGGITTDRFALSDPLEPLTLMESVGMFAEPVAEPALKLTLRGGFGGRHTFAEGARVIADESGTFDDDGDPTTDEVGFVTYDQLLDVHQAGPEVFAGIEGKILDGRVDYTLGVSTLLPLINNDDTNRDALELTRVAVKGTLGTKIFPWLTAGYQLKVISDPQLVDEVQVQHTVLLTAAVTAIDTFDPPVDEAAEKLKAAEQRATKAEARALEAEKRAAEAEATLAAPQPEPAQEPSAAPGPEQAPPAAPAEAPAAVDGPADAPADAPAQDPAPEAQPAVQTP